MIATRWTVFDSCLGIGAMWTIGRNWLWPIVVLKSKAGNTLNRTSCSIFYNKKILKSCLFYLEVLRQIKWHNLVYNFCKKHIQQVQGIKWIILKHLKTIVIFVSKLYSIRSCSTRSYHLNTSNPASRTRTKNVFNSPLHVLCQILVRNSVCVHNSVDRNYFQHVLSGK